jgi:copper homeostasis protein
VCAQLDAGGLTPDADLLRAAVASGLPCAAMVRPRAGAHVHAEREHAGLLAGVERARSLGARAVVLGALTPALRVDAALVRRLVEAAGPLEVVFHRAFDEIEDRRAALAELADLGVARVLTSGGAADAHAGRFALRELVDATRERVDAARGRVAILPGGGVRAHNAAAILAVSGVRELHSSTPFALPRLAGPPDLVVRTEAARDRAAVDALLRAAFDGDAEARLVERLRAVPGALFLVAELDGRVVGHVACSPLRAPARAAAARADAAAAPAEAAGAQADTSAARTDASAAPVGMGIAPLAVARDVRRRGVGAALVVELIARLRAARVALAVVLGDPAYHARFGFVAATPLGLYSRFGGADGAFAALELAPGAARSRAGLVEYDTAFDEFAAPA